VSGERCAELQDLFGPLALDRVERRDLLRLQAHLAAGCRHCAADIDRQVEAFAALGCVAGERPLPEGATDALLAAAAELPQPRPEPLFLFPETNQYKLMMTLLICAGLAVAAVAAWGHGLQRDRDRAATRAAAAEQQVRQVVGDYRAATRERDELRHLRAASKDARLKAHELLALVDGWVQPVGCVYVDPDGRQLAIHRDALPGAMEGQPVALYYRGTAAEPDQWKPVRALPQVAAGEGMVLRLELPAELPPDARLELAVPSGAPGGPPRSLGWTTIRPDAACVAPPSQP